MYQDEGGREEGEERGGSGCSLVLGNVIVGSVYMPRLGCMYQDEGGRERRGERGRKWGVLL